MKRETGIYPVHRFRRQNAAAKIQAVKGLRVEVFFRPLTVWIFGTGQGKRHHRHRF
jgi:hypothetical protein